MGKRDRLLSEAAAAMGRKGGPARARALEARRRQEIARTAALARWKGMTRAERRRATEVIRAARWAKVKSTKPGTHRKAGAR